MAKVSKIWIERQLVNLFLIVLLTVLTLDVIPARAYECLDFLVDLQDRLDCYLDFIGLWQGPYYLFAPDVKKENIRVSANIVYPNSTVIEWHSPHQTWSSMKPWEKWYVNYSTVVTTKGQSPHDSYYVSLFFLSGDSFE